MVKKYKLILFDFDGVIGDSFDFVVECIYNNMRKFTRVKLSQEDIAQELRTISLFEIIKKYKIPKILIPIIVFKLKRDLSKRLEFSKVFPNSQKVLESLQNKKLKIGLVTSNSKKNINYYLNIFNLLDKFDFVYTSTSLFKKDKTINKILKKYSLKSDEVLYVGDEVRDILACQKIGIDIVAVTYGYNSKELLKNFEPTYLVDSLDDINYIIK
ncbi:MAG: HAD-IA family hydrolase [Candidatus Woesearchaeota archaeon]